MRKKERVYKISTDRFAINLVCEREISILCDSGWSLPFVRWKILRDSIRCLTAGEWCVILNERSVGGGVIVGEGRGLMTFGTISYGKGRSCV